MTNIIKCKHCESNFEPSKKDTKIVGPHIGLYCPICGNYIKWISKKEYKNLSNFVNYDIDEYNTNNNIEDDKLPWEE